VGVVEHIQYYYNVLYTCVCVCSVAYLYAFRWFRTYYIVANVRCRNRKLLLHTWTHWV
jgi:hypothetical protein